MEQEHWFERWREGRIGFHEGKPNAYLERHADKLAGRHRVLVPLCGKSEDLAFLASRGHGVVGIELVEDAVRAFFTEHDAAPRVTSRGSLVEYTYDPITVLAGDFFAADSATVGAVDAIYDRAALVALPAEVRPRYVAHLRSLAAPGAIVLVVTVEVLDAALTGPPFTVLEDELRALYAGAAIEFLDEGPARDGRPMMERCFAVTL